MGNNKWIALMATSAIAVGAWAQTTPAATPLANARLVGFAQLWYADEPGKPGEFSTHRLRLGVTGTAADKLGYTFIVGTVEPPDKAPHLVDAYLDYRAAPSATVRVGQFLVPFGLEGPEVIWKNPAIERSTVSRRLNPYNLFRDAGAEVLGSRGKLSYAAAIVNGTGANTGENDNRKDVLGRVAYRPLRDLTLGVSGARGSYAVGSASLDRNRYGVDAEYRHGGTTVRGEFIGRDEEQAGATFSTGQGWYVLAAKRLGAHWEPVIRYEQLDPNGAVTGDTQKITTIGVNYYLRGNTRLSANYENRPEGDALTVQAQVVL